MDDRTLWYDCWYVIFFFFKQKTAYEMRISDWSSDVCSSDLRRDSTALFTPGPQAEAIQIQINDRCRIQRQHLAQYQQIGRASLGKECVSTCRSRWSPYH